MTRLQLNLHKTIKWIIPILQKTKINTDINPDEAIAYGAAVQGAILAGDKSEQVMI